MSIFEYYFHYVYFDSGPKLKVQFKQKSQSKDQGNDYE